MRLHELNYRSIGVDFLIFMIPVRTSCIVIAGGQSSNSVEILMGGFQNKQISNLPTEHNAGPTLIMHNEILSLCGGMSEKVWLIDAFRCL